MKELSEKERETYDKAVKLLTEFGVDCSAPVIEHDSGCNSVICKGEFGGYSIYSLIKYVAQIQGKKTKYIHDEY